MRGKSEKGSITIFVLVALLFYVSVLLLLYASNAAKMQSITKKAESVKAIYEKNINKEDELYNKRLAKGGETSSGGTAWVDNGNGTFTKNGVTVAIGDYVAYDATKDANGNAVATTSYTSYAESNASSSKNNGRTSGYTEDQVFNVNNYTEGWQVLGVKDGKLQLISASSVGSLTFKGQKAFVYGPDELNAIAAIYGQGKGATSARSINVDDVNSITGYDPANTGTGAACDAGTIYEYGNEVTYYWKGDEYPYYVGSNGKTGSLRTAHNTSFNWYDGSSWQSSPKSTTASNTEEGRERIATIKCTRYDYYPTTLTTSSSGDVKGITTDSNEYKTLFGQNYWLASRSVGTDTGYVIFDFRGVYGASVNGANVCSSRGATYTPGNGVRPVVSLASNIQVKSDSSHDGSTQEKAYTLQ